jgi:hypothetical protein
MNFVNSKTLYVWGNDEYFFPQFTIPKVHATKWVVKFDANTFLFVL